MQGVLFSLVPLIAWGVGDFFASKLSKQVNNFALSLFLSIIGWVVVTPLAIYYGLPDITMSQIVYFFLGSVFVNGGFLMMLRGFNNGPTGLVAPIANAYAIVTAIISALLFGDSLSISKILGIIIVVLGISAVSYSKPAKGEFKNRSVALASAVIALVSFGLGFTFFGEAATGEWYENSFIFQTINIFVGIAILLIFQKNNRFSELRKAGTFKMSYACGALGSIGAAGLFLALDTIEAVAIPAAIAAAAPLVTALMAYVFDKEHLTFLQRVSTVIIVAGIVTLSI